MISAELDRNSLLQNEAFRDLFQSKKKCVEQEESDSFIKECRREIGISILQTFGLGMTYDQFKKGGNLTTLHNAENGVFADQAIQEQYQAEYECKNYEEDFPKMRKNLFQKQEKIYDAYTGKELHKDGRTHVDHVVSAKEIHSNALARLYMSVEERKEMAMNNDNLVMTDSRLNQSKGAKKLNEWMHTLNKKTGVDNATTYGVDKQKAKEIGEKANKTINKNINNNEREYYLKGVTSSSVKQGAAMAKQRIIGVLIMEGSEIMFAELTPFINKWTKFENMKQRINEFNNVIHRVATKIKARAATLTKKLMHEGGMGFMSGIIANIVTILINTFATTAKAFVKILNDGVHAIIRAVKLLIKKPTELSKSELMKQVSIILSTAIVASIGGILTEQLRLYLLTIPILIPIAGFLSKTIGAILITFVSTAIIYTINNFGEVMAEIKNAFDDFKYGLQRNSSEIKAKYDTTVARIDEMYRLILNSIYNEYAELNRLADLVYDVNQFGKKQFKHSSNYANKLGVPSEHRLSSLTEIDTFFTQ